MGKGMNPEELRVLADPVTLSPPLLALWHDARGDWERAHEACQRAGSCEGDWVHAYLHRKEGDPGNAAYWYARAGRPVVPAGTPFADEWAEIAAALTTTSAGDR